MSFLAAHAAIAPMFWGQRRTLDQCADEIREWIRRVGFEATR